MANDRPCKECIWHSEEGCTRWACEPITRQEAHERLRRGRWETDVLDGIPGYRSVVIVCSECHMVHPYSTPYCPNCGAMMGV